MSITIQKNILLSKYTSFKIGGLAKYFCVAENFGEIKEALDYARENKLDIFILGGGSNLLISDKGFGGLIIKIQDIRYKIQTDNKIFIGSGMSLTKLILESVKDNLTGLETMVGIPGTVGGAIVNNAGAFGKCIGDVVESVEILEIKKLKNWEIKKLGNKECRFSYRNSIFKKEKKYIILNAVLKLEEGNQEKGKKIITKILGSRREKQPLEYFSAGSIFKNSVVDDILLEKLKKEFPELDKIAKNNVIPTGWLIEQIKGLKGKKVGDAMISKKHCNFIVNIGNAKAEDVIILVSLIKQKVRSHFGIQLKEEIEYVGF